MGNEPKYKIEASTGKASKSQLYLTKEQARILVETADEYGLEGELRKSFFAIPFVESGHSVKKDGVSVFTPNLEAVSSSDAKGPFQFLDSTAKGLGLNNPFDFAESAKAGAKYMKQLFELALERGELNPAAAASAYYNRGLGRGGLNAEKYKNTAIPDETYSYLKNKAFNQDAITELVYNSLEQEVPEELQASTNFIEYMPINGVKKDDKTDKEIVKKDVAKFGNGEGIENIKSQAEIDEQQREIEAQLAIQKLNKEIDKETNNRKFNPLDWKNTYQTDLNSHNNLEKVQRENEIRTTFQDGGVLNTDPPKNNDGSSYNYLNYKVQTDKEVQPLTVEQQAQLIRNLRSNVQRQYQKGGNIGTQTDQAETSYSPNLKDGLGIVSNVIQPIQALRDEDKSNNNQAIGSLIGSAVDVTAMAFGIPTMGLGSKAGSAIGSSIEPKKSNNEILGQFYKPQMKYGGFINNKIKKYQDGDNIDPIKKSNKKNTIENKPSIITQDLVADRLKKYYDADLKKLNTPEGQKRLALMNIDIGNRFRNDKDKITQRPAKPTAPLYKFSDIKPDNSTSVKTTLDRLKDVNVVAKDLSNVGANGYFNHKKDLLAISNKAVLGNTPSHEMKHAITDGRESWIDRHLRDNVQFKSLDDPFTKYALQNADEFSAYVRGARQDMLDLGIIDDIYQDITIEDIKEAYNKFNDEETGQINFQYSIDPTKEISTADKKDIANQRDILQTQIRSFYPNNIRILEGKIKEAINFKSSLENNLSNDIGDPLVNREQIKKQENLINEYNVQLSQRKLELKKAEKRFKDLTSGTEYLIDKNKQRGKLFKAIKTDDRTLNAIRDAMNSLASNEFNENTRMAKRGGFISTEGYKKNSSDLNNDYNIIPSNNITMKDVEFPVLGIDNLGNSKIMYPEKNYKFKGNYVTEIPLKNKIKKYQDGGEVKNNMKKAEIEGGEYIFNPKGVNQATLKMTNNSAVEYKSPVGFLVKGNSHEQGGIDVLGGKAYIASKYLGVNGKKASKNNPSVAKEMLKAGGEVLHNSSSSDKFSINEKFTPNAFEYIKNKMQKVADKAETNKQIEESIKEINSEIKQIKSMNPYSNYKTGGKIPQTYDPTRFRPQLGNQSMSNEIRNAYMYRKMGGTINNSNSPLNMTYDPDLLKYGGMMRKYQEGGMMGAENEMAEMMGGQEMPGQEGMGGMEQGSPLDGLPPEQQQQIMQLADAAAQGDQQAMQQLVEMVGEEAAQMILQQLAGGEGGQQPNPSNEAAMAAMGQAPSVQGQGMPMEDPAAMGMPPMMKYGGMTPRRILNKYY